jgi:hypothetical protein
MLVSTTTVLIQTLHRLAKEAPKAPNIGGLRAKEENNRHTSNL